MIRTLLHRVAVSTLDLVVERGQASERETVRAAAGALDRLRGMVGLDRIPPRDPLPDFDGDHPDHHMWPSDREKLHRHQVDRGIIKPEVSADDAAAAPAAKPALTIYFRRGCPYSRAALDLLKEREIPVTEVDMTDDQGLQAHVARLTGRKTSPQLLIHDQPIGGFDELRELAQSGDLERMIASPPPPADGEDVIDAEFPDDPPAPEVIEIEVAEVRQRVDEGSPLLLLDVRAAHECAETGVLPGALHIPLGELEARLGELDQRGLWITYCRSGKRSLAAREVMIKGGMRGVLSLRGGILAWLEGQGPTIRPEDAAAARAEATKRATKRVKLPVVHPERSPFEGLELADDQAAGERLDGKELVDRVLAVLDELRPMVQADGGDIELMDVQDDVVAVKLTGNCIGCPSSQATLRQGIERRLKQRIPQLRGISSPQLQPT
ncbi:MAG: NifU family protein [Nannocystaceae bacterium]